MGDWPARGGGLLCGERVRRRDLEGLRLRLSERLLLLRERDELFRFLFGTLSFFEAVFSFLTDFSFSSWWGSSAFFFFFFFFTSVFSRLTFGGGVGSSSTISSLLSGGLDTVPGEIIHSLSSLTLTVGAFTGSTSSVTSASAGWLPATTGEAAFDVAASAASGILPVAAPPLVQLPTSDSPPGEEIPRHASGQPPSHAKLGWRALLQGTAAAMSDTAHKSRLYQQKPADSPHKGSSAEPKLYEKRGSQNLSPLTPRTFIHIYWLAID